MNDHRIHRGVRRVAALLVVAGCIFAPAVASADANGRRIGLGLEVGDPSGISFGWFFQQDQALDMTLGFDAFDEFGDGDDRDRFTLIADFTWHRPIATGMARANLDWYFGVGPVLQWRERRNRDDDFDMGVRVPLGIDFFFMAPIDLFIEVAPGLQLIDDVDLFIMWAIGFRGWFP